VARLAPYRPLRQKKPPGSRNDVVRRPRLLLLTRTGPSPVDALRPDLDAVSRSGPSRTDLRKPKGMPGPYADGRWCAGAGRGTLRA